MWRIAFAATNGLLWLCSRVPVPAFFLCHDSRSLMIFHLFVLSGFAAQQTTKGRWLAAVFCHHTDSVFVDSGQAPTAFFQFFFPFVGLRDTVVRNMDCCRMQPMFIVPTAHACGREMAVSSENPNYRAWKSAQLEKTTIPAWTGGKIACRIWAKHFPTSIKSINSKVSIYQNNPTIFLFLRLVLPLLTANHVFTWVITWSNQAKSN